MARLCELCGANLNIVGDRHRCVGGRPGGQRPLTRLEAERIAKGDPASLISQPAARPQVSLGRVAPRRQADAPAPAREPQVNAAPRGEVQPSNRDLMTAIDNLCREFEALRSMLDGTKCSCVAASREAPRSDA
jgi:hypothetical protein